MSASLIKGMDSEQPTEYAIPRLTDWFTARRIKIATVAKGFRLFSNALWMMLGSCLTMAGWYNRGRKAETNAPRESVTVCPLFGPLSSWKVAGLASRRLT